MQRALELARKGYGKVAPNPMVGAVLVKNGKIISEGYHQYFGGPHAEVNVLKNMTKSQINDAILYVTLEPCCFQGKTPPCTNFLISKGIKDIVIAMRDPNQLVSGKGIKQLKKNGVNIRIGVLKEKAKNLNRVFIKNKTEDLPFVSIKFGLSLDGKIAPLHAKSLDYITNHESLKEVHRMRTHADAVLTTSETIHKDDSHLGVRYVKGKDPLRVVIDSKLRTAINSRVYRDNNVVVATTLKSAAKKRKAFESQGIKILIYKGLRVPLRHLLKDLYKLGVYNIMVEAGAKLATSLLKEHLADELTLFYAPKILGQGIPWVYDLGIKSFKHALPLDNVEIQRFGNDIMVKGQIAY